MLSSRVYAAGSVSNFAWELLLNEIHSLLCFHGSIFVFIILEIVHMKRNTLSHFTITKMPASIYIRFLKSL